MLAVTVDGDTVRIGAHFAVTFQRTLRIPDDGGTYPLPPGLGAFPVRRVADYAARVPADWVEGGGVFIPMYQREALWLSLGAPDWHPCAVKVAIGRINAITGKPWDHRLDGADQDYVVCPLQPWLDGINAGDGVIRQFVAMPLGMGYTVEGQVTGEERYGGLQIVAFDAKPGRFPDEPPPRPRFRAMEAGGFAAEASPMLAKGAVPAGAAMGLAAGGRMEQEIYPDPYGVETWDQTNYGSVYVHIVNSAAYREIVGEEPPPTPVSARTYTEHGYPWFALYDEGRGDLRPADILAGIRSVKELDAQRGFGPQQDDTPVAVPEGQVHTLGKSPNKGRDGEEQ